MLKLNLIILSVFLLCLSCDPKKVGDDNLVFVEGGRFTMGTEEWIKTPVGDSLDGFTSPRRNVTLDNFYIGKYEVTVKEFKSYCEAVNKSMPSPPKVRPYGDSIAYEWKDEYPMLATWEEADAYAQWAGGRLATEAEWEYAAKGGKLSQGYNYSGSNIATEVGWVGENSDSTLHPVGLLKPNELGLYDMTGNLSEWVSDWYNPKKDSLTSLVNPRGPADGTEKISKGVGWYYNSVDKRTSKPLRFGIHVPEVRYQSPVTERSFGFGFRIVKDCQ